MASGVVEMKHRSSLKIDAPERVRLLRSALDWAVPHILDNARTAVGSLDDLPGHRRGDDLVVQDFGEEFRRVCKDDLHPFDNSRAEAVRLVQVCILMPAIGAEAVAKLHACEVPAQWVLTAPSLITIENAGA